MGKQETAPLPRETQVAMRPGELEGVTRGFKICKFFDFQMQNVLSFIYKRKQERMTHEKWTCGLGSDHNLVPASCFLVEKIIRLAPNHTAVPSLPLTLLSLA